jgi:hypothetical protein
MAPGTARGGRPPADGLSRLLSETQDVVARLLDENRLLKAQNRRLADELERVSKDLDQVQRLARSGPRGQRR